MHTSILKNNKGFQWYSNQNICIKGSFFDSKNNYYEKEKLVSFFINIENSEQFIKRIKNINGIFTVLIKLNHQIFIASDTTRIFPLFYTFKNTELNICDDIEYLKEKFNLKEVDEKSSNEFLSSGFTTGNKTLLKNIYTLQSNEYIIFENNRINKKGFFFSYATKKFNNSEYYELRKLAIEAFENAFNRLIVSLNSRTVVIPLSGGYDSRLIALMLRKHNYKNVICYTYGKKNNIEIENSKKVAETLNFKWVFIEYTNQLLENYIKSEKFKEFAHYTCKYISMPSLQDFFAVKYLSENNLIPDDSIFIPGHSGDLLGGSQFLKVIPENLKSFEISNLVLKEKFNHNKISHKSKKAIKKSIEQLLLEFDNNYFNKEPSSVFEDFDIKEKITKIIFKASGGYTFFGYEHRFPYWDKELLLFFKDVPPKYKKMKLLYDDVLKNYYFNLYKINFENEIQPTYFKIYLQKIKKIIKLIFPKTLIKYFLRKNDWLNSQAITNEMIKSIKENGIHYNTNIKSYNEVNIHWYLNFAKNFIKK
ncbi:asparagine synthetase B family protein [Lutibacter citreus]|uniref:asparagine synthetase B family protein n=1 Tax=Lutibacter citreus TaxID=2138210 RepID=UPI000DBE7FBC|nr:asparagine synthetase B family protein [Lutibacter citreus]